MATFPENIAAIRTAVLGREVRTAIADSLEQTYDQYVSVEDFVEQMGVLKYVDFTIRDSYGFLWGDVNGDDVVSNSDLIIVQNYINGISVDPRSDGTTRWKTCVNFDTSTSDITESDRLIFATLISHKMSSDDYIARYHYTYENGSSVYLWGIIPAEVVAGGESGGSGGGGGSSEYILPVASQTQLGGVQPVTKTSAMTQSVGVDSTGRLFTEPGDSSYVLPVASSGTLGGVMPITKTSAMTQGVGVDDDGRLFTTPASITVDTALSSTSTNPVQNRVLYQAIGDIEALLAAL